MKQILAIVKPFRAQVVLESLHKAGVLGMLVKEAKGYGRQKDQLPLYRGSEYNQVYLPKIEIRMVVEDDSVDSVTDRIAKVARTGRIGDGKILVLPVLAEFDF